MAKTIQLNVVDLGGGTAKGCDCEAPDLSAYAKKEELPTKVSELENDAGYLSPTNFITVNPGQALTQDVSFLANGSFDCFLGKSEQGGTIMYNFRDDTSINAIIGYTQFVLKNKDGVVLGAYPSDALLSEVGTNWLSLGITINSNSIAIMGMHGDAGNEQEYLEFYETNGEEVSVYLCDSRADTFEVFKRASKTLSGNVSPQDFYDWLRTKISN